MPDGSVQVWLAAIAAFVTVTTAVLQIISLVVQSKLQTKAAAIAADTVKLHKLDDMAKALDENTEKTDAVAKMVNGQTEKLVDATAAASRAEGISVGAASQSLRNSEDLRFISDTAARVAADLVSRAEAAAKTLLEEAKAKAQILLQEAAGEKKEAK